MNNVIIRERFDIKSTADDAIMAVCDGNIDPIVAWQNIARMEEVIKLYKTNERVREITLRELSKYNKSERTFGDCRIDEQEYGTYDFSQCGDSKLQEMYGTLATLKADIKDRENMLKGIPSRGLADPDTGEVLYPPAKTSKTTIKTTFNKKRYE